MAAYMVLSSVPSQAGPSQPSLPILAKPHPTPSASTLIDESPFYEPEIDVWCSVCDKLIVVPRGVATWDDTDEEGQTGNGMGGKMGRKFKIDSEGRQHVIVPVAARLPAKKGAKTLKPGLKRSNTATQRLAQLSGSTRPSPLETSRPSSPSPLEPPAPAYNTNLYCSFACSDLDKKRSDESAEELATEMNSLWGSLGARRESVSDRSDVSWRSRGSGGGQPSPLASASTKPLSEDFGYFDMARYGVEYGLRERERRRSLHAQSLGSASSVIALPHLAQVNGNGQDAAMLRAASQTSRGGISSSDSLSSMWSSSDGRTFSEDSMEHRWSTYGSSTNNSGRNVFRGMTPLNGVKPGRSDSSGSEKVVVTKGRPDMSRQRHSSQGVPRVTPGSGLTAASALSTSRNNESGSAPVASLLTSYALSFPRTASTADMHRLAACPSPLLPPMSEDELVTPLPSTSSNAQRRSSFRAAFSPVCCASLASGSISGVSKPRSAMSDEASTPTQSLVGPSHIPSTSYRARQPSPSARSHSSLSSEEVAEDLDATLRRPNARTQQTRSSLSMEQRKRTSISGMLPQNLWIDSPTTSVTVGDEIIPRAIVGSQPHTPPPFCRSLLSSSRSASRASRKPSLSEMGTHTPLSTSHQSSKTSMAAPAPPHLTNESRTWTWDALERSGGKMYDLPPSRSFLGQQGRAGEGPNVGVVGSGAQGEKRDGGRLFYFHH